MTTDSSATAHEETPHETERTQITISDALRRRAQSVMNDQSIDLEWRTIIRFALELNDSWLNELVPRAEAGENMLDALDSMRALKTEEDDSDGDKIKALAEIICSAGDQAAAALFVLMGMLQNSVEPGALANAAKHFAFTRCGEFNVFGMVDAQLAVVEDKLLGSSTLTS